MTTAELAATTTNAGAPTSDETPAAEGIVRTRFGMVPATPEQQVRFKGGLPGFPGIECYQLEPVPNVNGDLMLMQSVDMLDVAFFVLPLEASAGVIRPADIAHVCEQLTIAEEDLLILTVVNLQRNDQGIDKFVNLRAPIFIDIQKQTGAQIVLNDTSYPLRLPLTN